MDCLKKKRLKIFIALSILPVLINGKTTAFAQNQNSHIHGIAELNVVRLAHQIQFEFISPAMNLLGFERAPSSAEDTALFEKVSANLQTSDWLIGNALGNCQMSSAALETPKYSKGHHEDEHEHDEHEQVTAGNEHSEFRAHYLFDCSAIPETKIPIMAFTHFGGIEVITVQWITETQQGLAELTATDNTLSLE